MPRLPVSNKFIEDVTQVAVVASLIIVGLGIVAMSIFGVTRLPWSDGGEKMDKRYQMCVEHGGTFKAGDYEKYSCTLQKEGE